MREEVRIVSLADRERWIEEHRAGGLPSQSWDYAWGLSASGVDPKLAVVDAAGVRMLLPFFERKWSGSADIATIIGLSGTSFSEDPAAPLASWREYARSRGWVAGYVQLDVEVEHLGDAASEELVTSNEVFLLELTNDDPLRHASPILRRKARAAERSGALLVDDRQAVAQALRHLYPAAMQRLGARPQYLFSGETLQRWCESPSALALGARIGDELEAAYLFLIAGDRAEYHISGSSERGRPLATWMLAQSALRLRERGVRTLNLGGGVRIGDSLYAYKEKFRATKKPLRALRQIYEPRRYRELCVLAGTTDQERWFPAYRAVRAAGDDTVP